MTLSRSQIPDAHASVEVDGTRLLQLCDRFSAMGADVTPFVLTLRLLTIALTRHAVLNSTWVDGDDGPQVHVHRTVNLGVAVATDRGLLVPVVTDAQNKTTRELAVSVMDLVRGPATAVSNRRNFRARRSRCPISVRWALMTASR